MRLCGKAEDIAARAPEAILNPRTFPGSELVRKAGKALQLLSNRKFRRGLWYRVAASVEHKSSISGLGIRTIVDVGANVGQFSLLAWSLYPHANIYAFEPQAKPAESFARLFPPTAPVILYRSAIGSRTGQARMHVSRRQDNSSLLPISTRMTQLFPGTDEVGTADISIAPLASFLSADRIADPALLKIDVQGAELDVLLGCEELLGQFRYVYAELSFMELYTGQALCHEIIRHLDQRGFLLVGIHDLKQNAQGRAVQADFLFSRDNLDL